MQTLGRHGLPRATRRLDAPRGDRLQPANYALRVRSSVKSIRHHHVHCGRGDHPARPTWTSSSSPPFGRRAGQSAPSELGVHPRRRGLGTEASRFGVRSHASGARAARFGLSRSSELTRPGVIPGTDRGDDQHACRRWSSRSKKNPRPDALLASFRRMNTTARNRLGHH